MVLAGAAKRAREAALTMLRAREAALTMLRAREAALTMLRAREAALTMLRARRRGRTTLCDRLAIGLLVLVPVLLEVPTALAGRPLVPGDDLTQNYPLRVLAGAVIRSGHLPGWDPFIWSGTPLLAGWNAGAMFPGTWLFAVMPGIAAWTVNLVLVGVACGTGCYLLLRRLRCREVAALLGALVFTYTGFMSGQIVHIGLVEGTACMPWLLVALDGLATACRGTRGTHWSLRRWPELGWVLLLGVATALTVLAGDPRAVSSSAIVAGCYAIACWWRSRHDLRRYAANIATGCALGIACAGLQWVPGIAFLHGSQRGVSAYSFFGAGSLAPGQLGAMVTLPFAVGGSGNLGGTLYFGNYNLPEVTIGVGLVALAAAFALLPSWLGRRARATYERRLGVWYVMVVVAVACTLGTQTPLGHLLVHVPLYSGERLQNRNAAVFDAALAVLLAFFVDDLLGPGRAGGATGAGGAGARAAGGGALATRTSRLLALVPLAWTAGLVACGFVAPGVLENMVHVVRPASDFVGEMGPYLAATLVLAVAIAALVLAWHALPARVRSAGLCMLVLADVATYAANAPYATVPSAILGPATALSTQLAARTERPAVAARTERPAVAARTGELTNPAGTGRFAIYDPSYLPTGDQPQALDEIGVTDLNLLRHLPSVQGYGSIVQGTYQNATNTHEFASLDQTRLSGTTFDSLDLSTLLTLSGYFQQPLGRGQGIPVAGGKPVTPTGAPANEADTPTVEPLSTGPWTIAPGGSATWLLASTQTVVRATVVVNAGVEKDGHVTGRPARHVTARPARHVTGRPARLVVGLAAAGGKLRSASVELSNGIAELELPTATRAERIVVENPTGTTAIIGAVVAVTRRPDERLLLDGPLQGALPPPHWTDAGSLGPFVVFDDEHARGAAWLEAPGSTSPMAPLDPSGTVTTGATLETGAQTMHLDTARAALLVRSETYASGWTARLTPAGGGRAIVEHVREIGLVQAIDVPAGKYTVTWRYDPTSLRAGLVLSAAGTVVTVVLAGFWLASWRRRRRRHGAGRVAGFGGLAGDSHGARPRRGRMEQPHIVSRTTGDGWNIHRGARTRTWYRQ